MIIIKQKLKRRSFFLKIKILRSTGAPIHSTFRENILEEHTADHDKDQEKIESDPHLKIKEDDYFDLSSVGDDSRKSKIREPLREPDKISEGKKT